MSTTDRASGVAKSWISRPRVLKKNEIGFCPLSGIASGSTTPKIATLVHYDSLEVSWILQGP